MPIFEFRMESPEFKRDDGSPHYRRGRIEGASKQEVRAELERREEERAVPYQADDIAELEKAEKDRGLAGMSARERGSLFLHRQSKPYKIVKLEEVKG